MSTLIERLIEFSARNRFLVFMLVGFASLLGFHSMKKIPLDALPDLTESQVIVYSRWDRSPDIIEDQVTFPIISSLLGAPKVKDIRGFSDFGYSFVYVIFQEGTDPYWARSRVLEYLSKISSNLPDGVKTELGPDATGVGWVFQYALVDESGKHSLAELRSYQDWFLKFVFQTAPGVAEVASLGGFQKQYQVQINPQALLAYKLSINKVAEAIRSGNQEIGARLIEVSGAEYMIRGRGYIKNIKDIEKIVLSYEEGIPITLGHVAKVRIGPEIRRGVADLDGRGDTVGGIIIMRYGENARDVIQNVKEKMTMVEKNLPEGVRLVVTYDRSELIDNAVGTLTHELILEMLIVSLVILIFLRHLPSALIPIVTLPLSVLLSFIPMFLMGITSNIMSLGGIAIAIGAMVDAAIIVVENSHKRIEEWQKERRSHPTAVSTLTPSDVLIKAMKEVGPASFYSLLVIAVSFLPIFALEGQEGKLFKPLAYTKTLSMIVAALLSITLDPALRISVSHWLKADEKTFSEKKNPLSDWFKKHYGNIVEWSVSHYKTVLVTAFAILFTTIPVFYKLGSEFMPPLNEGTLLFMPTTMPGISIKQAKDLLQKQDQIIKSFPEVERVFGKAGRADTSTDPAPLSMMETLIVLKPQSEWTSGLSLEALIEKMNKALKIPGTLNAWTMPIRGRIDMLTTGIRTPVGVKVLGQNITEVEKVGTEIEKILSKVPGTRSVFSERVAGGYFLDFHFRRDQLARYGVSMKEAQMSLASAVGGEPVTTTVEGRERYTINVRYPQDFRSHLDSLKKVLVMTESGTQIPLGQVADLEMNQGPSMIRNENGFLASYVYVDVSSQVDLGRYVETARKHVQDELHLPQGTQLVWSGQYENMYRAFEKLKLIVPITLLLILLLLYFNTKSWIKTGIILLAVPFSAIGAIWLLYLLDYNMSIAVWVGLIALLGVDAETGIFMLLYLDLSYERRVSQGLMNSFDDLKIAIHEGAVERLRPKIMTVLTLIMALLPILIYSSSHTGADVMKRIAAPMFGGIISSFLMELLVYPAIYAYWRGHKLSRNK